VTDTMRRDRRPHVTPLSSDDQLELRLLPAGSYRQQLTSIPLNLEQHFRCSSGLSQSRWRLRTFARNAVYKETSRSSDRRSITITSEWANVSVLIVILMVTFAVAQAVNLSFTAISRRQTNIKIIAGDVDRRTKTVKGKKAKSTRYDSKLDL
jgi:hypothetical protein